MERALLVLAACSFDSTSDGRLSATATDTSASATTEAGSSAEPVTTILPSGSSVSEPGSESTVGSDPTGTATGVLDGWFGDYPVRRAIRILPRPAPLTDFPVAILTDEDDFLAAEVSPTGSDIVFTEADGETPVSYETELYEGDGTLTAWVRVPELSSTEPTLIYLYYGGGLVAPQHDPATTWSDRFAGVWHFQVEDAPQLDSTSAGNHAFSDDLPFLRGGVAGRGVEFTDGTQYLEASGPGAVALDFGETSFAYSAWVRPEQFGCCDSPVYKGGPSAPVAGYGIYLGDTTWEAGISDGVSAYNPDFGLETDFGDAWTFLAVSVDRGALTIFSYTNGQLNEASEFTALGSTSTAEELWFGNSPNGTPYLGRLDEVRIYRRPLSEAWVRAEYDTVDAPGSFFVIEDPEPRP